MPVGSLRPLSASVPSSVVQESGSVASHGAWDSEGAQETQSYSRHEPTPVPKIEVFKVVNCDMHPEKVTNT